MPQAQAAFFQAPASAGEARRQGSRERMLAAAAAAFCARDYLSVTVEDIASAAGVSRMTFYRHFGGKAELAIALFEANVARWMPRFEAIKHQARLDLSTVQNWIADLFEADRQSGQLLQVFMQANADGSTFTKVGQQLLGDLVQVLGERIPAFAADPAIEQDRKRWLEAWLLLYEILDQSNHSARGAGAAPDPLLIELLSERFLRFVETHSA